MEIQLASQSPRRRELLAQIGVRYKTIGVHVPERRRAGESPTAYVMRLARAKARAGLRASPGLPTLGADTIVCCDDAILEKPANETDGARMLTMLSSRAHRVMTAVAITGAAGEICRTSDTEVFFKPLSPAQIAAYWRTGEPRDKAGGYAIQGLGAIFVERINGSYSGVVGLPIEVVSDMLGQIGVPVWTCSEK